MHTVTASFRDPARTTRAVQQLLREHFDPERIMVFVDEGGHDRRVVALERKTAAARGALLGAGLGALFAIAVGVWTSNSAAQLGLTAAAPTWVAIQTAIAISALGALSGFLVGVNMWRQEVDLRPDDPHTKARIRFRLRVRATRTRLGGLQEVFRRLGAEAVEIHPGLAAVTLPEIPSAIRARSPEEPELSSSPAANETAETSTGRLVATAITAVVAAPILGVLLAWIGLLMLPLVLLLPLWVVPQALQRRGYRASRRRPGRERRAPGERGRVTHMDPEWVRHGR